MLINTVSKEQAAYENDPRPKGSAFIIAMPGAGGEMLLDLLVSTALTNVLGTQEPSFYHAITALGENLKGNTYGNPYDIDDFRFYAGREEKQDVRMFYYYLRNILLRGAGQCIAFTDLLRDEEGGEMERFCQVVREISDHSSSPLRLVFLTCDFGDSINTSHPYTNEISHNSMLNEMKNASELGDIWITKKELLADPLRVMIKIKATHYPNADLIPKVMKKYL